jgi:hypothetical protein
MVQVVQAGKAEEETLNNLLQLYLHDFSEFDGGQVSSDGQFEYPYLARNWGGLEHRSRHLLSK